MNDDQEDAMSDGHAPHPGQPGEDDSTAGVSWEVKTPAGLNTWQLRMYEQLTGALEAARTFDVPEVLRVIETVDAHLDSAANPDYQAQPLAQDWARVTKPCEEAGEVWKAWSRCTGENPRHRDGILDHTRQHVLSELGDTITAAFCAIQHLTKDTEVTWLIFLEALEKAWSRVPAEERGDT